MTKAAEPGAPHGRIVLLASRAARAVIYRYDDTNPDGRTARLLAGNADRARGGIQANRCATADDLVREPGSRYIDFLIPGLLGMNLMGSGNLGHGVRHRGRAQEEAASSG